MARKLLVALLVGILAFPATANAAIKDGSVCKKFGQVQSSNSNKFVCTKVGKKIIWKSISKPTPAAVKTVNAELAKVTTLLNANNFKQALSDLKVIDSEFKNNADVNNLLGYSSRKLKQYKPAAAYYEKALKLNPNHLGALEYQGELFVLTNKVSAAKKNLVKLEKLCGLKCGEYLDLKKAIGKK